MRIRRALPRPALPVRTPRTARCVMRIISQPIVLAGFVLVLVYFAAGLSLTSAGVVVVGGVMAQLSSLLRKRYRLHNVRDDPTKPERFYH